jgi:hypothetical protein
LTFVKPAQKPAQQGFGRVRRITTRHGIATEPEAVRSARSDETMKEEAAFAQSQYDFTRPKVIHRAACNLDHIVRPK